MAQFVLGIGLSIHFRARKAGFATTLSQRNTIKESRGISYKSGYKLNLMK